MLSPLCVFSSTRGLGADIKPSVEGLGQQESARCTLQISLLYPLWLLKGKHLLFKSQLTIYPALEYASLKVYVFGFYRRLVQ